MKNFKKIFLSQVFISMLFFYNYETAQAQLVVNTGVTTNQLIAGFIGSGITVSNPSFTCLSGGFGTFSNGNTTNIGITNGAILTTGCASGIIGPNNSASYSCSSTDWLGSCNYSINDPDLQSIEPQAKWDPCILTFNVVPSCSTLTIQFVFGSEEYPEFVGAGYNDAFGFFVTGPNPSGPAYASKNIALLPNGMAVSIDNVNATTNSTYFVNNTGGSTIQYDGFTKVITSNLNVTPCATYAFKIAIADAGDCVYDSGVLIQQLYCSSAVSVTTSSQPTCSACTGTATANVSNGQPPYTYSWNTSPVQTGPTATGLCPGNYIVTVSDQTACILNSNSSPVTVAALTAGTASIQSSINATCGLNTGSATATISGGISPFTYSWNTTPVQNTQTAIGLGAGTYTVHVTDANGCSSSTSVTIINTAGPTVSATVTPSGCTVANGSATATPSGGVGPFTYSWNTAPVQNTQTANNLSAGIYTVTATDVNGCSAQTSVTVTNTNGPTVTAIGTSAGCTAANGSATATPSGGTGPFTYLWSTTPVQNTQTANNLPSGTYTVTVIDVNGCSAFTTVTISPTGNIPSATASANNNVSCFNGSNGSATATPSGGTPGYTYTWNTSPAQNTSTANNLSAGNYSVTVTDANGCSAVAAVSITAPPAIILTANSTSVTCSGNSNGSATANASGGVPGYSYSWNTTPVQNTQTANNLFMGTYQCTVTDVNGCTKIVSVTVNQPPVLAASTTAVNVLCNGGNNGSATATPSGGTPAYTYSWNTTPVQNTQTANNLSVGNYTVTITDAHGCTKKSPVTITEPLPILLSVSGNDSLCQGANTLLTANANGGTPNYTYSWSPGPQSGTSVSVNPSASTSYTVSMTDANGCVSLSQTFNVLVLPAPAALFDTASSGTFGSTFSFSDLSTPSVTITAWNWNFGDNSPGSTQQNPVHTFPGSGVYTITEVVFNQFGCPDTFKITVNISEGIIIPNVFTPDGDGVNDVWYIPNSGMKEFHVTIYDRWGAKVFETTADEIHWDGHSRSGHLLSDGTYYYVLKAILKSGAGEKDYSTTGYVTLLTKKQ